MLFLVLSLAWAGPALPDPTTSPNGMKVINAPAEQVTAAPSSFARLHVDVLQPAEILFDGIKLGQLWVPAKVMFEVPAGQHILRIYTQGKPFDTAITLTEDTDLRAVVGRTGVTVEEVERLDDSAAIISVDFRVLGVRGASIRMDGDQHLIDAGRHLALELSDGSHALSVRSSDGTVIWASGQLTVHGGSPIVVQIAEGRMPEISGAGSFNPGSGG